MRQADIKPPAPDREAIDDVASSSAARVTLATALPAVVLMGIGFSTPYAVMMDEAQRRAAYAMKNATSDIISA